DQGGVGRKLWKMDATGGGMTLVKDFGSNQGGQTLTHFGSLIYFSATDAANGTELWQSDGTSDGTMIAQDINPGPASSSPTNYAVVGDALFFAADDGTSGRELWALPLHPAVPPTVLSASYDDSLAAHKVIVRFSQDVHAGLDGAALLLTNLTAGASVAATLSNYDPASDTG